MASGKIASRGGASTLHRTLAGLALAALTLLPAGASVAEPLTSYKTSWIGNSEGFGNGKWVQYDIRAIYVAPDGTVYSNAPWDESGAEISAYRDGKVLAHGGHTHGWGNQGGDAIAGNSRYIYAAALIGSENGHLSAGGDWPEKGLIWAGVTRRLASDITRGKAFQGGRGNIGTDVANSFLVVNQLQDPSDLPSPEPGSDAWTDANTPSISGMAADERSLFVANRTHERIEVYDAETMQRQTDWPVSKPGKIALSQDGGALWVIEAAEPRGASASAGSGLAVHEYSRDGRSLGFLALPAGTVPSDVKEDATGRLLVADNGPRQQILVFSGSDAASMHQVGTIGEPGGIFAKSANLSPGTPGPLRFNGLAGIGVDGNNNLYVANNGAGPRPTRAKGTQLESYTPKGQRRWVLSGLLFVDNGTVDPGSPNDIYTGYLHFHADFNQAVGHEAEYAGFLPNRFAYPESPMLQGTELLDAEPMVRRIQGHRILYSTDMYSQFLSIYRFDEAHGETAIPSGYIVRQPPKGTWPPAHPDTGAWLWRDADGNGAFSAAEYERDPAGVDNANCAGWWVDRDGGIWVARDKAPIRYIPLSGLDAKGNPVYHVNQARDFPLPEPFTEVKRVQYDSATDTLYLSGYTADAPYLPVAWKQAGRVMSRYDNWLHGQDSSAEKGAKVGKGKKGKKAVKERKPTPRYSIVLPWVPGGNQAVSTMSVVQEHDYIFAVEMMNARVHVYDSSTGRELGFMDPGPEVGRHSGWVDVTQGISAYRRDNGEYVIFVEEDSRAKVLMYRWHP